ncbi:hypothetical protein MRB53_026319 [Persea americana]|uniref:Uncharacterized protein n=1 Tax=Persea americana TaxID=3435 RepID=A0ACC2LIM5_PERAE|nr:hypothetical protein MRB53_026319 [Persea americana]
MALVLTTPLQKAPSQTSKQSPLSTQFSPALNKKQVGRWSCRKKDIHPNFYEDAKVYCKGELVMTTGGTQKEYVVDVWSGNHPFYLGNRSALVVDADQVEKFRKKFGELSFLMDVPPIKKGEAVLPRKPISISGKGKAKKK